MRFPIMIFGYTVLTDALSYHDLWFSFSYKLMFMQPSKHVQFIVSKVGS